MRAKAMMGLALRAMLRKTSGPVRKFAIESLACDEEDTYIDCMLTKDMPTTFLVQNSQTYAL